MVFGRATDARRRGRRSRRQRRPRCESRVLELSVTSWATTMIPRTPSEGGASAGEYRRPSRRAARNRATVRRGRAGRAPTRPKGRSCRLTKRGMWPSACDAMPWRWIRRLDTGCAETVSHARVSVVIPCLNEAANIVECVRRARRPRRQRHRGRGDRRGQRLRRRQRRARARCRRDGRRRAAPRLRERLPRRIRRRDAATTS